MQTKVTYSRTGVSDVIVLDEGFVYVTITNPCIVASGGAITANAISGIDYWIKDAKLEGEGGNYRVVSYFADAPTTRDGSQTYLYTNGGNLCGPKTIEIVDADKNAIVYSDAANDYVYDWLKFWDNGN